VVTDARVVRARILRAATAMHNACLKTYKEDRCVGCPFNVGNGFGCDLYGHPIEWKDKIEQAKTIQ
jgi:hypothetical protein